MHKSIFIAGILSLFICLNSKAQADIVPYASNTTSEKRAKELKNLVNNSIIKNLSVDLNDSTAENWQSAFDALIFIRYRTAWVDNRIRQGFDSLEYRTHEFQRTFLELIYTNYPTDFIEQIVSFAGKTYNGKLFMMCFEYVLQNNGIQQYRNVFVKRMKAFEFMTNIEVQDPFQVMFTYKLSTKKEKRPALEDLLEKDFLKNEIVVYSIQRKNRNYPGLALVRGSDGVFNKDSSGNYFSIPQLARSNSNMPGYLTNGNTPQGIFKMTGFAVSKSSSIGPTSNIQMLMPYEKINDLADSVSADFGFHYADLLPASWKKYLPIYESYHAGVAGRTEIIAHGTTVNPEYYKGQPYYPFTPTQGCLCSKELWSATTGERMESDQQKLVDALKKAGGAVGYCVVIEIDDQQKPVGLDDIILYLKKTEK